MINAAAIAVASLVARGAAAPRRLRVVRIVTAACPPAV
jgi:glutaminase